jgi:hypothetical protein
LPTHGFFLPEIELGRETNPLAHPIELGKQINPLQRPIELQKETNPLQQPSEMPKTKLENPMHRSGLALAGAHRTLKAWSEGEVPPIENDGIVTAEQVGGLKLNGAWLVVLSACETGSGEARAGEGVMGLRRGFIQAGEQNLLMTLCQSAIRRPCRSCWISTKQRIRPATHPKDRRQIEPWKV